VLARTDGSGQHQCVLLPLRAREQDRLRTVRALQRGYLDGQLSTGTFEARVAVAQRATSTAALLDLLADLTGRWLALQTARARWGARTSPAAAVEMTLLLSHACSSLMVGRSRSCDLRVDVPAVSRRHALLQPTAVGWTVTDLNSTNGTYLDGVRVDRAPVPSGCTLWLGDARLYVA
jgi:hypothetical protein